jgi:hypothetical protein
MQRTKIPWGVGSINGAGVYEYKITDDPEIFPVVNKIDKEISVYLRMGRKLTFKDSDYFMFILEGDENKETGFKNFDLVCGITGTRASRTRWSIARCLEDFVEGMEKRGHVDAKEFKACAESLHPVYAAKIKEWRDNGEATR